ncbi:cytochrome P450 [Rickenella mellea]|uniref:Cytochrome P450 n=1 Tax=Rickenella mellea TaxID=50990 RepID=A0A4Y7Q9E6_9AGAM|nr:cytochrome P450 [Rickenella mellea]
MSTIAYCLAALLSYFAVRSIRNREREDIRHAPGPSAKTASWIWGHELEVFNGQAIEAYSKWMNIYGPLIKIKAALFHHDLIIVGDHAAVQQIFTDTNTYRKSPSFSPVIANTVGKGLVWAEGDEHAHQRRLLLQAFTLESVKGMSDDVLECAERLESRLANLVLSNDGAATVNIVAYTSSCTLDVIGRVSFGHDFRSGQSTEAQEIAESWNNLVNMGLTFTAFLAPVVLRAFPFITSLPVKSIQAQGQIKTIVGRLARKIVDDGSHIEKGKNMLSIMMRYEGDGGLSTTQIIDNITTFTMAGHETTSGVLAFTLLELARHPEVQKRLRDEVIQYGGTLSYDTIPKLEYLDAVVKEGLRIHPAAPQTERVAMRDDVLPLLTPIKTKDGQVLTTFKVRKGQVLYVPFTAMQTNPAVWGVDATEFKPERWITPGAVPQAKELPHGWSNLVAFCDGPRNCIGYRLALFELKAILATLVRTLAFHPTDAVVEKKITITLQAVTNGNGGVLPLQVTLAPP